MSDIYEMVIEIIGLTDDGYNLSPKHLKIVQHGCNGFLNEEGLKQLKRIYHDVRNGTYQKPWFHGIEHLTIDGAGYVMWKGMIVEHYERPYAYSEIAKLYAARVAEACLSLEKKNNRVLNTWQVIDEINNLYPASEVA